jgi:uncharacterized CHY-type Zn-finger protein
MAESGFFFEQQSPSIRRFLDGLAPGREQQMQSWRCVLCGKPATEFRDELSAREYEISGTCQACQDEVFAPEDDDAPACPFCGDLFPDPGEMVCVNANCREGRHNLDLERADEICHALRDEGLSRRVVN